MTTNPPGASGFPPPLWLAVGFLNGIIRARPIPSEETHERPTSPTVDAGIAPTLVDQGKPCGRSSGDVGRCLGRGAGGEIQRVGVDDHARRTHPGPPDITVGALEALASRIGICLPSH